MLIKYKLVPLNEVILFHPSRALLVKSKIDFWTLLLGFTIFKLNFLTSKYVVEATDSIKITIQNIPIEPCLFSIKNIENKPKIEFINNETIKK